MSVLDLSTTAKLDSDLARTAQGWRVFCVSPKQELLEEAAALLRSTIPAAALVEVPTYPELPDLEKVITNQATNILLLDVITNCDRAMSLIPEIIKLNRGVQLIAMLAANEPQLILRCLRQGASEFVLQPFSKDQFETALNKIARALPKEQPRQAAKVIAFMSAKGACGASTLATNLAFHARRNGAEKVLLADLDPLTGTISFLLKVKSTYSFIDVLSHLDGLDIDMWKAMIANRQGVDVLLSPEALVEGVNDLRDATQMIEFARANYDVVVLDAPSVYGEWNLSQAKLCDELILTTTNELPALQATQRALSYLESNRVGRWKIKVVVNRYDKDVGLGRDVIGTALHTDVFHVVPSDYEAVQKSLLEGKPVPPSTGLGKSFTTLGDRLTGKAKPQPKQSGSSLGSILSLFSRTSS